MMSPVQEEILKRLMEGAQLQQMKELETNFERIVKAFGPKYSNLINRIK